MKKITIPFLLHFCGKNLLLYLLYIGFGIIGIGIGRYEKCHIGILSVSADKKIEFIGLYRYRPIWKKAYRSYTDMYVHLLKILDYYVPTQCWVNFSNRLSMGKWSNETIYFSKLLLKIMVIEKPHFNSTIYRTLIYNLGRV